MEEGTLHVNNGHSLHWQRHGRRGATPVFFLHGGPGGKTLPDHLSFFDLRTMQVILFDQRGCGRSTPQGSLRENTADASVDDIEALRRHFDFDRVGLLGISWGSWLALRYQQRYRAHVSWAVLACLFVPDEGTLGSHAGCMRKALQRSRPHVSPESLYNDITSGVTERERRAAWLWARACLDANSMHMEDRILDAIIDEEAIHSLRIELHYHVNSYFGLVDYEPVVDVPSAVVQGREDTLGMASLHWLKRRLSLREYLCDAGHDAFHPAMLAAICEAVGVFARSIR